MIPAPDIPGYSVTGVCGQGGFATVYRALQQAVGREVAVKVDNRVLLTERDRRRFLREVTAAGRLSGHPNVIDLYDAGMLPDGRPYLVMELCPAGSLLDELRRHGPMPPARVRDIGVALADALAAAHQAGVLHRDIKPANVLINRYGLPGFSDFGLASLLDGTEGQSVTREALTPAYAPPEAFRAIEPTVGNDVYSLAATLYALLAGAPPHVTPGEEPPTPVMFMMRRDTPPADIAGVPPELMAVLQQGLAFDPAQRPPSAAALRDAIAACSVQQSWGSRPAPGGYAPPSQLTPSPHEVWPVSAVQTGGSVRAGGSHRTTRPGRAALSPRAMLGLAVGTVAVAAAVITGVLIGQHGHGAAGPALAGTGTGTGTASTAATAGTVAPPNVYGITTTVLRCPAALVPGANARCPARPECWGGLVVINGDVNTPEQLPCNAPHVFQTFAIAILPAAVRTWDSDMVKTDPTVMKVCSLAVMLRSRLLRARLYPASAWEVTVMPPDETQFEAGARYYRCVADLINGVTPSSSQFSP